MESLMSEKKLYAASLRGDIQSLNDLLRENELVLNHYGSSSGFCFSETPLHIAAARGHVDFAKALLQHKPDLVNELDSRLRAPLHLASANGQVEMVKLLLEADSDVCFYEDEFGRTPLHLAAMVKGRVEVVNELVRARPETILYPLNKTKTLTILHSYVIRNGPKALDQLVEVDLTFLNSQDAEGNTILHKVVALRQVETLKYLISKTQLVVNFKKTLDIIDKLPRDSQTTKMRELLVEAGALNREINVEPVSTTDTKPPSRDVPKDKKERRLENKRNAILVAATVIAGMAYQAGLSPPGGLWDHNDIIYDEIQGKNVSVIAGTSIMATNYPYRYIIFWGFNTASFVAALSIVLLLIRGSTHLGTSWLCVLKQKVCMWILTGIMWVMTTTMAFAYIVAMVSITPGYEEYFPKKEHKGFEVQLNGTIRIVSCMVLVWLALVFIVFLVNVCRFLVCIVKNVCRFLVCIVKKVCCFLDCIIKKVAKCIKGPRRNANEGERQGHSNAETTTCCMSV